MYSTHSTNDVLIRIPEKAQRKHSGLYLHSAHEIKKKHNGAAAAETQNGQERTKMSSALVSRARDVLRRGKKISARVRTTGLSCISLY